MTIYHRDGTSDETPVTPQRKFRGIEPINHSHKKLTSMVGRSHKTDISGNCKRALHSQCFNLHCPCDCHPKAVK